MREILFRGKRTDNGEWAYGGCVQTEVWSEILAADDQWDTIGPDSSEITEFEVYPETVGQYTGLKDKNGKKIFEGDIIKHYNNADFPSDFTIGKVYYDSARSMFLRTSKLNGLNYAHISNKCVYEVIGNIHDSPELLKGENENG